MVKKGGEEKPGFSIWNVFRVIGMTARGLVSVLFFLFILFFFISLFTGPVNLYTGNIAVIPIKGVISTTDDGGLVIQGGVPSDEIVKWIKDADEEEKFKAILLEIDSPGGSPVATDEISRAVKEAKKPVIAVIREVGASGAFWIATATDKVYANRMSLTGSIGVTSSRLEFAGMLRDYNVTYRRLVSGKYKDAGSRWKEMTPEEQLMYQKIINKVHVEFVREVARNRKMSFEEVAELAHGFVFLGSEALEFGLIDELGTKEDAVKWIEKTYTLEADLYEFEEKKTFIEAIAGVFSRFSFRVGEGIGSSLTPEDSIKITT